MSAFEENKPAANPSDLGGSDNGDGGEEQEQEQAYKANENASKNVGAIMSQDAEDESLRKYKEKLLGAAALGDLGDTSDPRRFIVMEFRVKFEDPEANDVVFNLDTEEGIRDMQSRGFVMKEGCSFKFELQFKVQHEIVTGVRYITKVKKVMFTNTEEVMIGSYAPQSAVQSFSYPRHGYEEAPSGLIGRGKYTATDKFVDLDGTVHLTLTYPFQIKKGWA